MIAVPTTPATTMALIQGANSRTEAMMKKEPRRSGMPKMAKKLSACRPGAPKPKQNVEMTIGIQHSRRIEYIWSRTSPQ